MFVVTVADESGQRFCADWFETRQQPMWMQAGPR